MTTRRMDPDRLALLRLAHALGLTLHRQGPLYTLGTGADPEAQVFGPARPGALLGLLSDLYAVPSNQEDLHESAMACR